MCAWSAPDYEIMKANIEIDLEPFTVPNFAREKGRADATPIPLDLLSPETLWLMCNEFRAAVFKKAGKKFPDLPAEER